ncbi:MAG TPA: ABC transporter permease [Gammaproteobacteria bacterium]|nr:ABC transporter permease [Gammaproteobacteria bacterium]
MKRYFSLVLYKAITELKAESSRAFLGILWWIVEPLLYMAAFYTVFAMGMRGGGREFVPFLLCGLVPWKWFNSTVQVGANTIVNNRGLIEQVYLPKLLLLISVLVSNFIRFLIILALLFALLAAMGYLPGMAWLWLPYVIVVQIAVMLGIACWAAAIIPFLPDFRLIIDNGLLILFFMSGIFYDVADRPAEAQVLFNWNPLLHLVNAYRDVLMHNRIPDLEVLTIVFVLSLVVFAAGAWAIHRLDRVFPKVIE